MGEWAESDTLAIAKSMNYQKNVGPRRAVAEGLDRAGVPAAAADRPIAARFDLPIMRSWESGEPGQKAQEK